MAVNPTPEQLERYRREAMEFASRSTVQSTVDDLLPEGSTVEPEVNPPSTADDYAQFLREHPSEGTLKVQTTTARGSFPISGATVEVAVMLNGNRYVLYNSATDQSGISDNILLPARPAGYSQNASTAAGSGTQYSVSIFHPAFDEIRDEPVTVFESIQTILPVALQPTIQTERRNP